MRIWRMGILVLLFLGSIYGTVHAASAQPQRAFFPFLAHQRPRPTLHPFPESVPYVVQEGDTLFTLARRFHRSLDLMACALPPDRPATDALIPGETLLIPPKQSVCHVVAEGQTLQRLARAYGVSLTDIIAMPQNRLENPPYDLQPGQRVLIPLPDGSTIVPWDFGDGQFIWPVRGIISQAYSPHHKALDIATEKGSPVAAADTGVVAWAGWNTQGYGWLVILDHRNGYRTYYAHLDAVWVAVEDRVIKGQPIGVVGSTGHSTGPHLHFEVRDYGLQVDPLPLLHEGR